jgi:hypothetical protein
MDKMVRMRELSCGRRSRGLYSGQVIVNALMSMERKKSAEDAKKKQRKIQWNVILCSPSGVGNPNDAVYHPMRKRCLILFASKSRRFSLKQTGLGRLKHSLKSHEIKK